MISELQVKLDSRGPLPWAGSTEYFKNHPVTEFKPGLNIIFGGNGSGKSTMLQMLALALAARQGGTSTVTTTWLNEILGFGKDKLDLPFAVKHDGQPIMYFDARKPEGLDSGAFDDDFFSLGVVNTMRKGSTGQQGLGRLERFLYVLKNPDTVSSPPAKAAPQKSRAPRTAKSFQRKPGPLVSAEGFPASITWKVDKTTVNDYWMGKVGAAQKLLAASIPTGPKTIILDEPDSGYSFKWQAALWETILGAIDPAKLQVIVATHSPFALGLQGANYIEISPGYVREAELAMWALHHRLSSNAG